MRRDDLRKLTSIRPRQARVLLGQGEPSGAYYLLGYEVECALTAAIAKATKAAEFPDRHVAKDSYSSDFQKLVEVAGLKADLDAELNASAAFRAKWNAATSWRSSARYEVHSDAKARDLLKTVAGPMEYSHG